MTRITTAIGDEHIIVERIMKRGRVVELGSGVAVEMRVSERARRWRVQVGAGGVVVVRPRRMSEREALRLLDAHAAWVAAQVDRLHALYRATAMPPGTVRFQGHPVPVRRVPTPAGTRARVELAGGELLVHLPGSDDDRVAAVLEAWLRDQARQAIGASVALHAARMNVKPARIGIRSQRTRWGSCSRNGGLSFNWRLIQVPQEVLDYVVVHELAHMVHPNHSPDFWLLVQRHCPGYPAHKRWLRRHAATLGNPPDPR